VQYRHMGKSDLVVSAIGFGCWEMGGGYGAIDDDEVVKAIHRALDLGVTLFDTARGYGFGRSEALLARGLGTRRKDVAVVTKCGMRLDANGRLKRDSSYQAIVEDCELSLKALATDYVDLFLVHWPDLQTPFDESMRALNDLRAAGKVRYVGVSNFSSEQLRTCAALAPLCANQIGYNLFDRRWEYEMFPTARELGIGIMAYGPLAHGLLTGTFTPETKFDETDWRFRGNAFRQPILEGESFLKNLAVIEQLKAVAKRKRTTLPKLALAWVLANPTVAVALTGVRRPAEIEDNVGAVEVELTPADHDELAAIMKCAAGQVADIPR